MNTLNTLTNQEHVVLALVAKGWRNTQIAQELFISTRTVENHVYHIFDKLGVSSRTEAALYAFRMGWMAAPEMSRNPEDRTANDAYARKVG
jgi:NarL family two-component system response regulator LiaR